MSEPFAWAVVCLRQQLLSHTARQVLGHQNALADCEIGKPCNILFHRLTMAQNPHYYYHQVHISGTLHQEEHVPLSTNCVHGKLDANV